MTSTDNSLDMPKLELLLREHFARTEKQLSDMRKDNAEFRTQMIKEFNKFEEKINTRLDAFEEKTNARLDAFEKKTEARLDAFEKKTEARLDAFEKKTEARLDAFEKKTEARFDKLEAATAVMQNDITGLKHDVAGLYHWDYWLLSIILVVFAMPQIVAGIKSLFTAIAEGVSLVINAFRPSDKQH